MPEQPLLIQARYRSAEEAETAALLDAAGIKYEYEDTISYEVPASTHKYKADFRVGNIVIEYKGRFATGTTVRRGNKFFTSVGDGAKERKKLILVRDQHPELDLRLIFSRPGTKINKGSPTSYAMWADKNGFKWCKRGEIPNQWIEDLKKEMKRCKLN